MPNEKHTGFAIALAWPETWCKQPGSWYDSAMSFIGVNKNHYYKVGHAAVILINASDGICHYFDFGRYHTPYQFGRVRNKETDNDLEICTRAKIVDGCIVTLDSILQEVSNNPSSHGVGRLYASYCRVDFRKTLHKAKTIQQQGILPYGPFVLNGTNCSRFVRSVTLAGNLSWLAKIKLALPPMISVTPKWNVLCLGKQYRHIPYKQHQTTTPALYSKNVSTVRSVLPAPQRQVRIPATAKWLSGEGAGSWYTISKQGIYLQVIRYSPEGDIESQGYYQNPKEGEINLLEDYEITYLSQDNKMKLIQNGQIFVYTKQSVTAIVGRHYKSHISREQLEEAVHLV